MLFLSEFLFCLYLFKFLSAKYWKGVLFIFCLNLRSFFIVLISFLLNVGNKMC